MALRSVPSLAGRRVLITGAARGIGAELARRLHSKGARVAVAGLEDDLLTQVASSVDGPSWALDVRDRLAVERVVDAAAAEFGGLDVVVANAGIAAQLPLVGGDPTIFERTIEVNVLGSYYTLRAAGPHLSHGKGYGLAIASVGAVVHLPLMGAYSASKAAVEAFGNTLRQEMRHTGARVGVAYFAELDTDMTTRGFGTEAAKTFLKGSGAVTGVTPLKVGIDALEHGIARRSRRIVAPAWGKPILPARMIAQRVVEVRTRRGVAEVLDIALKEKVDLTTPQPERSS